MCDAGTGRVAVGVGPAMAESYVADAVTAVVRQYPPAQIIVRVDHWQQLSQWLLAGELDYYVADVGATRLDRRLHHTRLPAQEFIWFCRAGHPLASRRRKPISRNEMLQYPIATPKMPAWATEWFATALGEQGAAGLPPLFPAVECESYAMLKRIVLQSDCISAALQQTLSRELEDGSVTRLPVDAPPLTTQAGIIRLRGRPDSKLAGELATAIADIAQSGPKQHA